MNNCIEYALDDLMAVVAIPVDDMSLGTASWQLDPIIPAARFSPRVTNAITIGLQPVAAGGKVVPIVRASGKAKDSESDSVAGRLHTVSVNCDVDDRDGNVWTDLLTLERTPAHLLLTFRNNVRAFVAATADTYMCHVERDGAKTSVTFRVENLLGVQLICK